VGSFLNRTTTPSGAGIALTAHLILTTTWMVIHEANVREFGPLFGLYFLVRATYGTFVYRNIVGKDNKRGVRLRSLELHNRRPQLPGTIKIPSLMATPSVESRWATWP
jgi:hypothetical protein